MASNYLMIIAKKALPAKNLTELITWLKANPDKASAGTAGVAGIFHLAGILFQNITGIRFQLVPYRGIALAMQDLVAGQIDLIFADTSAIAQVEFEVACPAPRTKTRQQMARVHEYYCCDIADEWAAWLRFEGLPDTTSSIVKHAAYLLGARLWQFWWD
jgi:Tripartite tricarboxylate transporter family receptor